MRTVDHLLAEMTPEEKVGQLLYVRLMEDEANWPTRDEEDLIKRYHIGAVRMYWPKQNPAFYRACINQLQEWALSTRLGIPLIVGLDAEPGLLEVVRDGITFFPPPAGLTACGSLEITRQVSAAIARESLAIGFNLNQRPASDVNVNPANPIVGLRSPSDKPEVAAAQVEASVLGARAEGLAICVKHFPGHGDAAFDTHHTQGAVHYGEETLRRVHLPPFVAAIRAGADAIMTGHLTVSCLDPEMPATLSPRIMTQLLREEMGFQGVVITDGMTMAAIKDHFTVEEAVLRAFLAGNDLILSSYTDMAVHLRMYETLLGAYRDGRISEQRLDQAVRRVLTLKANRDWFAASRIGTVAQAAHSCASPEHLRLSEEVLGKSITVIKNEGAWPLRTDARILVTGVGEVRPVARALAARGLQVFDYQLESAAEKSDWSPSAAEVETALALAAQADTVLVLTFSYWSQLPAGQRQLLEGLKKQGAKILVVALSMPYEARDTAGISGYLLTYFQSWKRAIPKPLPEVFARILAKVLTGAHEATGHCPFEL